MKICLLVYDFPALSETFILNQVVALLERGHDIEIHAKAPRSGDIKQHAAVKRWELIQRTHYGFPVPWTARTISAAGRLARWGPRCPMDALDSLNIFRYGRWALSLTLLHERLPPPFKTRDFDVIHCHYGPNGQRGVIWRKLGALQGPVLTTFHGYDVNLLPKRHGNDMYRELFQGGDFFTVGSEFMRQRVLGLGAPPDRLVKLPIGIDLSCFKFCPRRKVLKEFRLLTVARLVEVKGIEHALRAVALMRTDMPELRYIIVGDGPLRLMLEELAKRLSIEDVVCFKGALSSEEVEREFAAAHAFVLPGVVAPSGEQEGQSLVIAEAQACGIPVIATAVGGIPESLRNWQSGILVPPADPLALGSALITLARNTGMREQMGRAGRALVESDFNLATQNNRLVEIYNTLRARFVAMQSRSGWAV